MKTSSDYKHSRSNSQNMIDLQQVSSKHGVIKIKNTRNPNNHLKSNESQESDHEQIKIEIKQGPATR